MSVTLRKRVFPSGKTCLFLDIYQNGARRKELLKLYLTGDRFHNRETLRMAESIRAKRELELQASYHGLSAGLNRNANFVSYVRELRDKARSEGMKNCWDNVLARFISFAGGDTVVFGQLTRGYLENFKDYLLSEVSQNTAQKYFSILKTALYHAVRHDIILQNPAQFITIKKVDTLPKFLTLEEVRRLAATACENRNVRNAFLFSCFTGLRYGDILTLTWDKVKDNHLEFTQHKTGNSERLPLGAQAILMLEDQAQVGKGETVGKEYAEKTVFFMPRQSTTDKALKRWAERAALGKRLSFHKARHTFATLSLTYGVDLYTTSKLLGHRDLRTTQIYAKIIDEKKQQAVDLLPMLG